MKKIMFLYIGSLLLLSCQSEKEEVPICGCSPEPAATNFKVLSGQGTDLLNPEEDDSFKESDIRVYFITDADWRNQTYHPVTTNAHNIDYSEPDGYSIRLGINDYQIGDENPVTLIKWKDNIVDTITAGFRTYEDGGNILEKVWVNGELLFDENTAPDVTGILPILIK